LFKVCHQTDCVGNRLSAGQLSLDGPNSAQHVALRRISRQPIGELPSEIKLVSRSFSLKSARIHA
jgi:hypothetical protein